jgi:hypothetical protein
MRGSARISGRDSGLDEHLVRGIVAIDLNDVAEGDAAARLRVARIAGQRGPYLADRGCEVIAPCRHAIAEPARFQRLEPGGIVGRLTDRLDEPGAIVRTPRRHHELDVLHVLAVVTPELVDRHVDEMRAGYRSEFLEGREKFVVAGRHDGSWQERAHRERIDQPVVELLVAHGIEDRHRSRTVALRFRHHDLLWVNAKLLLRGPGDEALGVDGAGEVGVEIAALGHAMEERTQRRSIFARRLQGGRRVEFARQHRDAQQDDEGRQQDDGKDDPTSQGLPRCGRCSAKLAVG